MADKPDSRVLISEFQGLMSNVDNRDLPEVAAQIQNNFECLTPGKLSVRQGYVVDGNFSSAGSQIISMFQYQRPEGDWFITVHDDGKILATNGTTALTLASGVDVTEPWSFAKDRFGNVAMVNGKQRGYFWDGITVTANPLGITQPINSPPVVVTTPPGGAATAGQYLTLVRYVDDRAEDIYSAMSADVTVTAAIGDKFDWVIDTTGVEARVTHWEAWRSTADAPNQLYFIARIVIGTTTYTLDVDSDDTLISNFIADTTTGIPVFSGGTEVVARRQGVPPESKGVVCNFQDRMFYLADPSAVQTADREAIYYSAADEMESVLETDTVTRQINTNDTDDQTAAAAFGSLLYVFSERFVYTLSYIRQPKADADVRLIQHRGLLSKAAWDIHEGVFYGMDQQGCYSMTVGGGMTPISDPIQNIFRDDTIDWPNRKWFHTCVDQKKQFVRFYVGFAEDLSTYPQRVLVYNIRSGAWSTEGPLPDQVGGSCPFETTGRIEMYIGAGDGRILLANSTTQDTFAATTDIPYEWKSKAFRLLRKESKTSYMMEIINQPTSNAADMDVKIYKNLSLTAHSAWATRNRDGVSVTNGSEKIVLDLTKEDGLTQVPLEGVIQGNLEQNKWAEFELSGIQGQEPVVVSQVQIDGVE